MLVVVPVYELIVGDVLQIAGINIERTFIQPHEKIRLEGVLLRLPAGGVARCRVPVTDNILELAYGRALSPAYLLEVGTLHDRVVETLLLPAGEAHLCQYFVYRLLGVLFRPYGRSELVIRLRIWLAYIHHAYIDDVPVSDGLLPCGQFPCLVAGT